MTRSQLQVRLPPPEPRSEEADPLHGLEPAVRARLQELGQMGFPLDRLRRLHGQFNGDEKQVRTLLTSWAVMTSGGLGFACIA